MMSKQPTNSESSVVKNSNNQNLSPSSIHVLQQRSEIYYEPLPSPQAFGEYEKVLPGCAERIVSMAELDQKAKIDILNQQQATKDKLVDNIHNENMTQLNVAKIYTVAVLVLGFIMLIAGLYEIIFKDNFFGYALIAPSFFMYCAQAFKYLFPKRK